MNFSYDENHIPREAAKAKDLIFTEEEYSIIHEAETAKELADKAERKAGQARARAFARKSPELTEERRAFQASKAAFSEQNAAFTQKIEAVQERIKEEIEPLISQINTLIRQKQQEIKDLTRDDVSARASLRNNWLVRRRSFQCKCVHEYKLSGDPAPTCIHCDYNRYNPKPNW